MPKYTEETSLRCTIILLPHWFEKLVTLSYKSHPNSVNFLLRGNKAFNADLWNIEFRLPISVISIAIVDIFVAQDGNVGSSVVVAVSSIVCARVVASAVFGRYHSNHQ